MQRRLRVPALWSNTSSSSRRPPSSWSSSRQPARASPSSAALCCVLSVQRDDAHRHAARSRAARRIDVHEESAAERARARTARFAPLLSRRLPVRGLRARAAGVSPAPACDAPGTSRWLRQSTRPDPSQRARARGALPARLDDLEDQRRARLPPVNGAEDRPSAPPAGASALLVDLRASPARALRARLVSVARVELLEQQQLQDWRRRARCRDVATEIFYPPRGDLLGIRVACSICRHCDVRDECLAEALARGECYGIWGGLTFGERRRLRRRGG